LSWDPSEWATDVAFVGFVYLSHVTREEYNDHWRDKECVAVGTFASKYRETTSLPKSEKMKNGGGGGGGPALPNASATTPSKFPLPWGETAEDGDADWWDELKLVDVGVDSDVADALSERLRASCTS
jgi:hypothetical protein